MLKGVFWLLLTLMLVLQAAQLVGAAIAWRLECLVTGYCR